MSFYKKHTLSAVVVRFASRALRWLPLFLLAVTLSTDGFGQSTGSIRGTVKNSSTGKLLSNAAVVVEETGQRASTDEYGTYRINNVPAGEYTVTASFVGLRASSVTVSVDSGVSIGADIVLRSNQYMSAEDEEVFELEAFEVGGSEYNSNAVAQNERKMSSSLKLVQDSEALGEIAEGNIGEFLKNLPGVAIDYVAADARSIKLRGMGAEFTQVTVDGAQMASAGSSGAIRQFELEQVSLSNVEHLEVTKLPRADMPANSMGGSVNLVSKNAFAQGGRKISYKAYLNWNSHEGFDLGDSPGWMSSVSKRKTKPGFEINFSDVFIEDKLGASFTFSQSNQFNIQQRLQRNGTYRVLSDGSIRNDRISLQDGPKFTFRQSFAANFDYKLSDSTIFTLRSQANEYDSEFGNKNYNWRINSTNTAASSGGHIEGTPHPNDTEIGGSNRHKYGTTYHLDLGTKHTFGDWRIDYGISRSEATNHYDSFANGYVTSIETGDFIANSGVTRLAFDSPSTESALINVTAYDADGNIVPNGGINLEDGRLKYIRDQPNDSVDIVDGLRFNAKYDFELGERQASVKFGFSRNAQSREANQRIFQYNAVGDAAVQPIDVFVDKVYKNISPGFGYDPVEWPSFKTIYEYYQAHPQNFVYDDDVKGPAGANIKNQTTRFFELEETVTAYYAMGQIGFAGRKGLLTAGVRQEDTDISGRAAIAGQVSLDENDWITGNFQTADRSYSTTHPSAHIRFNFTDKLVGRLGYADTIGRPNFGNMFGPASYSLPGEDDDTPSYLVKLKNAGLRPRRSDNIDATLEYYFGDTSLLSASLFRNDIEDYEGTDSVQMTQALLDELSITLPLPAGYQFGTEDKIETVLNFGDAKVDGLELAYNQSLDLEFMPEILRSSSIYWNGTFLDLEGNFEGTSFAAFTDDLPGFAKRTISYGVILAHGPASLKFRWNIRGQEVESGNTTIAGTKVYRYIGERPTLDINGEYKLNDRATLYFSGRNVENTTFDRYYYYEGQKLLFSSEDFGVQWSVGVKGKF